MIQLPHLIIFPIFPFPKMIQNETDIDDIDWIFLPETKHDPEPSIHGQARTISDTKLVVLTDYFNPESVNEKIKEPFIESVNEEVKTQQVSLKEPVFSESVDKMDSSKSTSQETILQTDAMGTFNFDEKIRVSEKIQKEGNSGDGLSLWKWSLNGVGAICSFGFAAAAAATFCVVILGSQHGNRQQRQDQNMFFQHYSDEKRMKQMVDGTSKVNEAKCAGRVPIISRAHITIGGYYNAL